MHVTWDVLQCVAVCCGELQSGAECCSKLYCVAVSKARPASGASRSPRYMHPMMYCRVLQCVAMNCRELQSGAEWCSVVQCGAVVQCAAVCCSVLQCRKLFLLPVPRDLQDTYTLRCVAVCCSVL